MPAVVQTGPLIYRFGPFDFQAGSNRLQKNGLSIRMERKPLLVLIALLERPSQVVSREELQRRLWPEDTFVDFELGLRVAVNKLRDALSDSPDSPRYIETVVGEGYRFIAAVEVLTPPETELLPSQQESHAGAQAAPVRRWSSRAAMTAALVLLTVAAMLGGWRSKHLRPEVEFSRRDWVLISRFENRTGNPSLDGSLETLLERETSNSSYVNVVPPQRVRDTLRLMRLTLEGRPPLPVAREVALRDGGIKAVIAGKAERIADRYVIGASVVLPADGTALSSYTEEAGSEEQIVPAMRRLSNRLRERLGEDIADIQRSSESLEKVTTPSLPALRLFTQAMSCMVDSDWETASRLLEETLRADPDFATAQVYLAHTYANLDQKQSAALHWDEAFRLADRATEAERLFILGSYYHRYRVDLAKAIEAYETLLTLHPNHFWAVNNLAFIYSGDRQWMDTRKAAHYAKRRAELRPTDFLANYYAWDNSVGFNHDYVRASVFRERALRALTPDQRERFSAAILELELEPLMRKVQTGDLASAVNDLDLAEEHSSSVSRQAYQYYASMMIGFEEALGRFEAAQVWIARLADSNDRNNSLAELALARGDQRAMADLARHVSGPAWWVAYYRAHSGNVREAERLLRRSQKLIEPRLQGLVRGEIALQKGDYRTAVRQCTETLSLTVPKSRMAASGFYAAACAATAWEKQGALAAAADVLEVTAPEPGYASRNFWIMLEARRAVLYRQLGRNTEADHIAQRLQQLLVVADPDHPARALLAADLKPAPAVWASAPPTVH